MLWACTAILLMLPNFFRAPFTQLGQHFFVYMLNTIDHNLIKFCERERSGKLTSPRTSLWELKQEQDIPYSDDKDEDSYCCFKKIHLSYSFSQ